MTRNTRFACFAAAAALVVALLLPVHAAGAKKFSDLDSSHWAYSYMMRCSELGIMSGFGNNEMGPSRTLDWAQYLTMLCHVLADEQYDQALADGLSWDQAAYAVAEEIDLIEDDEFLPVSPDTLDTPLTRQEVAVLLDRILPEDTEDRLWFPQTDVVLRDVAEMDAPYRTAVERLIDLNITSGKTDNTFGGGDTLMRADGSVFLIRVLDILDQLRYGEEKEIFLSFVDADGKPVGSEVQVPAAVGDYDWDLYDEYAPEHYAFDDEYRNLVSIACDRYTVRIRPMTEWEIQEAEATEKYYAGEMTYEEYELQDFWLRQSGENPRKYLLLFGTTDKRRFANRTEAEAAMTSVKIPVWKIAKDGSKVSSSAWLSVHAALAEDVVNMFTEIYNDPEQFPIKSIGGYSWRGDKATGEHNCGTAIDINPNENYQIREGKIETGSLWAPGTNPYSMPPDGIVVRTFLKYGWRWGGDAWAWSSDPSSGYHDYMHFSYMGK